ncbi:MAG TPA: DctP family TRAP transporter solute-binding subunit [Hyphomicrobiaceae bacterium]|jgi:C4-dicarboxylate-binding protein DctP|nr:DctP family TRAP transporter solute-binding subunit [Hyphomicrobiaceae bacterium]
MNRREVLKSSAALAAAAAVGIKPASAQNPLVIKYSHVVATDAPKGKAAIKFAELAEKYTGGKVKVEVYANSSLYKDKEELEALQLGAVHILAPSTSKFGPLGFTEFEALDLPFMFRDDASFTAFAESDLGKQMFAKLETKGVKGLSYLNNGFHNMGCNKKIQNVKDFRGLKLRIQGSKVLEATTKAWGAIPQVMAFSEVYHALQTGVVDGLENVPSNFWTQKFYEVVKYMAVSHHGHLSYALVTNAKFWDGLSPDIKPGLEKAIKESSDYFDQVAKKDNDDAMENMRKTGKMEIYPLSAEDRKSWVEAVLPVHKEMEKRVGKDTIAQLYKVVDFKPA